MRPLVLLFSFCSLVFTANLPAAEIPGKCHHFSHFLNNGEDGLHLAWSANGLNWQALNDGKSFLKPEVGKSKLMRAPCVTTGPECFSEGGFCKKIAR